MTGPTLHRPDPGTYRVRLDLPSNDVCSAPAGCVRTSAELRRGVRPQRLLRLPLAALLGSLSEDLDADGTIDATEAASPDRSSTSTSTSTAPATSDEPSRRPAPTARTPSPASRPAPTPSRSTSAPAGPARRRPDCRHTRTLGSGAAAAGLDFAAWRSGQLGGTVFNDLDGDGSRYAGEARAAPGSRSSPTATTTAFSTTTSPPRSRHRRTTLRARRPPARRLGRPRRGGRPTGPAPSALRAAPPPRSPAAASTALASLGLHKLTGPARRRRRRPPGPRAPQTQTLVASRRAALSCCSTARASRRWGHDRGEGEYALDPETGLVTFTPVGRLQRRGATRAYRVTDADGATADGTYTPTVEPPVPRRPRRPRRPRPPPRRPRPWRRDPS